MDQEEVHTRQVLEKILNIKYYILYPLSLMENQDMYEEKMANQKELIDLGGHLRIEEIKNNNQKEYLEKVLSDIKDNNYFFVEEELDLKQSYKNIFQTIEKSNHEKFSSILLKGIVLLPKNDYIDQLTTFMLVYYLLSIKSTKLTRELELANETKESIDEQYEDVIDELEEKEKELKLVNDNFNSFKLNSFFLFLFYNYLIYFSTEDIIEHLIYIVDITYYLFWFCIYYWTFFGSLIIGIIGVGNIYERISLIIGIIGVGDIYERIYKYKND
jgi:Fe2+ transport system protein B